MSFSISSPEKSNFCQSISFYRFASNCLQHCINEKLGKCGGGFVSDDPGEVMVNFIRSINTGQKNKMYDDYNSSNFQVVQSAQLDAEKKGWVTAMVKLQFNKDGVAHVYFEAFNLSDNGALKTFKQGWFHFHPKISKDTVLGGVRGTKGFLNGFFLVVVGKNHQDCDYSSLLSLKRKSSSRDCWLSPPMEILTRYDFHHVVSTHYYPGTSRPETAIEVISTSCLGVSNNSFGIGVGTFPCIGDDVMVEILSRLPVKSLMRFKSVCKHWLYLIKQDKGLIDLHFNHSKSRPRLLCINPLQEKGVLRTGYDEGFDVSRALRQSISFAEIVNRSGGKDDVEAIISKIRITDDDWFLYDEVLGPVNGLLCFVDRKTFGVRVYNASTRELTPWVKSTLLAEEKDKLHNKDGTIKIKTHHRPIYHFGFDPEKKEYKVFCFWRLSVRTPGYRWHTFDRPDYARWEVLTLGRDTKWRKINMVPDKNNKTIINEVLSPYDVGEQALYADGTLYWRNKINFAGQWGDPDVIVALDVGSEKFRVIPIPSFILDEPHQRFYRRPVDMLMLGGRVALLFRMEPQVYKLWMLDDGVDNKLKNCQGSESNWSGETIQLPFYTDARVRGFVVGGSTENIVLERHNLKRQEGIYADFVSLYSYDRRKGSCKKIEIDGVSLFPLRSSSRSLITSFTESLYSVT
ncbi:hypothetical protein C5167_031447 [Papaver somniferum]|uniref:F-box domain-containing protein n=2 Tax=Papaver somniferum TaxID=3469 RepID=A0A4Y7K8D3_PAPSO|nr:hypothetical protein C5167_031447 [Papaver somniferum]